MKEDKFMSDSQIIEILKEHHVDKLMSHTDFAELADDLEAIAK